MKIQLYPSLQFGWDLPQFQTVVREYLREETEDEPERTKKRCRRWNLRRKRNDPVTRRCG